LAYHTLHETLDTAQNFGVPYSLSDRYATLEQISPQAVAEQSRWLISDLLQDRLPRRREPDGDEPDPAYEQGTRARWASYVETALAAVRDARTAVQQRDALIDLLDRLYAVRRYYRLGAGLPSPAELSWPAGA
ncbi:MAG TPA: hypothetical protein VGD68_10425, partial [Streptosporangiaceae bacterium]